MSDIEVSSSSDLSTSTSASGTSNGVLLATVLVLFFVVVLIAIFYLYAKKAMGTVCLLNYTQPRVANATENLLVGGDGLDPDVLRSLPFTVFDAKEFKDRLECAVCLSDLNTGENVRILPKCNHGFHVKCIDKWFHSHSTCPLCRSPVSTDLVHTQEQNAESVQAQTFNAVSREGYVTEPRVLPTNVSLWGTQDVAVQKGTSSSESTGSRKRGDTGTLVIDIPRRTTEILVPTPVSSLPTSVMPLEELKSPGSAPFWSLQRLFIRGMQLVSPPDNPRESDIEQGTVSTPNTARSTRLNL